MKCLIFSDGHAQGINSRNRLGNYFQDWLLKFDELLSIAKDKNCDMIIDTGDLFESNKPSYSVLDEIADRVEKNKIPIYSLFGNHCEAYGNLKNSNDTGLMHLQKRSKLFCSLTNDFPPFPDEMQADGYEIKAIDYEFGIEEKLKNNPIYFNEGKYLKIIITHALITPNKFFDTVSYVTPEQIKTNADLVICSHYHIPFCKKVGNTEFINIGCFGRLAINEAKIEPSVMLLDTDKRYYEIIKLKSAKKGTEIFDLSKYNELKANEKSIQEFLDSLKSSNLQNMDLKQQIIKIGKDNNVKQKIIDNLLDKINVK